MGEGVYVGEGVSVGVGINVGVAEVGRIAVFLALAGVYVAVLVSETGVRPGFTLQLTPKRQIKNNVEKRHPRKNIFWIFIVKPVHPIVHHPNWRPINKV